MKKIFPTVFVFSIISSAFYFCKFQKGDSNLYLNYSDRLTLPFDTMKVLAMMNIADSVNEVEKYLNEKPFSEYAKDVEALYPEIDTIDLIDMRFACDCPNWRYADSLKENYSGSKDFYLEPADEKLKLNDYLYPGQRIQFIGREYHGNGYPQNPQFEDPHPPMGRVFRYYAYKIYKPFKVYGPEVESKTINDYDLTGLKVK